MRHLGLWTLPLAAALLAGCGPSAAPAATAETAAPAAWHWEAQTVDLQGASSVGDIICKADGTVQLCLYDKSNDEYRMLVSADNGETWTSQFPDWLPGVLGRDEEVRHILSSDEGTWLVLVGPKGWNEEGELSFWLGTEENLTRWKVSDLVPGWELMAAPAFLGDGRLVFLPATLELELAPDLAVYDPATGGCTTVSGAGEQAFACWQMDADNAGERTGRSDIFAPCGAGSRYVYMTYGANGVQLRAIDPDTGTNTQLLEDVPGGAVAAMTGLPDGTLYFLNGEGIWRLAAGGTLPELVVEIPGKDLAASSPENRVSACLGCAADGSFLVLTHDAYGASTLTRYAMVSE